MLPDKALARDHLLAHGLQSLIITANVIYLYLGHIPMYRYLFALLLFPLRSAADGPSLSFNRFIVVFTKIYKGYCSFVCFLLCFILIQFILPSHSFIMFAIFPGISFFVHLPTVSYIFLTVYFFVAIA